MKSTMFVTFTLLACLMGALSVAHAACRPAPPASGFAHPGSTCPAGYSRSGTACVPGNPGARYAFFNDGGPCPSGYYSSGNSCVANAANACHAFYIGGGSCPSGYFKSGNSCLSN